MPTVWKNNGVCINGLKGGKINGVSSRHIFQIGGRQWKFWLKMKMKSHIRVTFPSGRWNIEFSPYISMINQIWILLLNEWMIQRSSWQPKFKMAAANRKYRMISVAQRHRIRSNGFCGVFLFAHYNGTSINILPCRLTLNLQHGGRKPEVDRSQ
jgi:hypothetical protein